MKYSDFTVDVNDVPTTLDITDKFMFFFCDPNWIGYKIIALEIITILK